MTLYGRKPVQEVLSDNSIDVFKLHLAESNTDSGVIKEIKSLAQRRGIETVMHSREALSRISRNRRQDQGVAIDIQSAGYLSVDDMIDHQGDMIGLDGITNPQNLGMIIRSVAASPLAGLLLPKKGCASIDPLVHKASAGTLFKSTIIHSPNLDHGLKKLKAHHYEVIGLTGDAIESLVSLPAEANRPRIFLLGNETTGLSDQALRSCDRYVSIPMYHQVESINVAAAATLVAFRGLFTK